jgi:hypothetical protein
VLLAERSTVPSEVIESAAVQAESLGYARRQGNPLVLTDSGQALAGRLTEARREVLAGLLGDWDPRQHSELAALVTRLSNELCGGDTDRPQRPAAARRTGSTKAGQTPA